jgi:hypothetical protein
MDSKFLLEALNRLNQLFVVSGAIPSIFQQGGPQVPGSAGQANSRASFIQLVDALEALVRPVIQEDGIALTVARNLGLEKYSTLESFQRLRSETSQDGAQVQQKRTELQRDFTQFRAKITQALSALQPFSIEVPEPSAEDGIVEIVFKGEAGLSDFGVAYKRMVDWYRILQGYARALHCAPEDFQIVSMEMHSPAKWKIRTKLEYAKLFLEVVAALTAIELSILQSRVLLEQLKSTPMTSPEVHETFVKEAEGRASLKVKQDIDTVVTNALNRAGNNTPEVKNFFLRGVETQYQFNVSGGEVNVYLPEQAQTEKEAQLAKAKQEVQKLQARIKELQLEGGPRHSLLQPPDTSDIGDSASGE